MLERKRDVYLRVEKVSEIVETLKEIMELEEELKELFYEYDTYNLEESKIFENWSSYLDDILLRLDHVTL